MHGFSSSTPCSPPANVASRSDASYLLTVTIDPMDERFMRAAIAEARKGLGQTSPNPAVGAVLARRGRVLARGHHRGPGKPHAEVECLTSFKKDLPVAATLYVTLEPCSTLGRTPPCTSALIEAGVRRVVIGSVDVNPAHSGRGIELLQKAGLEVVTGVLADQCAALNEPFNKWIRSGRPFVIAKCGMTLDGRLTRPAQEEQAITGTAARAHANRFRAQVDAILIGAETLRADNPRLTVRTMRGARQPWRVVLTRSPHLIPGAAHLFSDRYADRTLVFDGSQSLEEVLAALGQREITSVLLEGGGEILSQALDARLIDKVHLYCAPLFAGGPVLAFGGRGAGETSEALRLRDVRYQRIGSDLFIEATAAYET